jgi:hypothetical protein
MNYFLHQTGSDRIYGNSHGTQELALAGSGI